MNDLNLDPSLFLLILKICFFLVITYLTGWAINPNPVFKQSRVSSWVYRQSLGTGLLLLIAFNLVNFDIAAKWVVIVPPLLLSIRLVFNRFYTGKMTTYTENCDSFYRSLFIYTLGSLIITIIYLMPLILTGSSGLYAFGGGDHSSYFRVSDLVVDKSLKDLILSWGLVWPPTTNYVGMSAIPSMFPPTQNWSINSFLFYIKYARQSMTFANQTIGVPFLALGFNNPEESYTAAVTVYLLLLCWSSAVFALTLIRKMERSWGLSLVACAVALASPAMSLVLKQTIPAVYAWGSMLLFLSVMLYKKSENNKTLGNPWAFGISFASTYLMYLPAIFVSGPLWAFLFLKGMKPAWKERIKWLLIVVFVLVAFTNVEMDRPIRLFLSNAIGAILDYGLKPGYLPFTMLGVVDFESVLEGAINYPQFLLASAVILIGLYLYIRRVGNQMKYVLVFTMPILFLIGYYWSKGGHYHVIRMIEFLGVVFVAMSITGFFCAYNTPSKITKFVILGLVSLFVANAVSNKVYIDRKIISPIPDARAGILSTGDMKVARILQREYAQAKTKPVVYWMGWGTIPFANHEIAFRNLRYVEAFEYDYSYVNMDLLAPQFLNGALLLYPTDKIADVLQINPAAFKNEKFKVADKEIQKVGTGSGAAILGTGWLAPTIEQGKSVRYIRSAQEAGLVIWSEEQKPVQIEIDAFGIEPGMSLTLRRPELENDVLAKDKTILRGEHETSAKYFVRLEKLSNRDSGSADFLRFVQQDLYGKMRLTAAQFNELLSQSKAFKQFIIYSLEKKSKLSMHLEDNYHSQQLTYKLPMAQDDHPTKVRFNFSLHKGANIIRFISRDKFGHRSARDIMSGVFYNPDINVPYVVVRKIYISPVEGKLEQL
ncbi:MAG: hypothetical protein P4M14_01550 [Gammaproteobacteria bacterium]|nr:hypothetical protein [Gammaproteobacteria bacterium]